MGRKGERDNAKSRVIFKAQFLNLVPGVTIYTCSMLASKKPSKLDYSGFPIDVRELDFFEIGRAHV